MFSESSSSAFIQSGPISNKWSEITLLQVRSRNALYSGIRHGRKFLIKAIKPEYGSLYDDKLGHDIPAIPFGHQYVGHQHVDKLSDRVSTQSKILQEKEFRLGILLNHPNIMSTYSLEEVEDLGLCIVAEWIEGVTLGEWLKSKQNIKARRRVFMQILDALEYIHSLQLVHNDIKLDNIMVTTNGTNVKLIDFGLSNTDDTVLTESNDVRKDIVGVGKLMGRMFPHRYPLIKRRCMQGAYAHIGALRKAIFRRSQIVKWLYALLLVVLVLLCAALINDRVKEKVKKQEMLAYVKNQVDIDISKIYALVESKNTYLDAIQALGAIDVLSKRDSLVNLYADDPTSAIFVGSVWDQYFVPKYNQLIQELSTNRTKWPYPEY
jgi:serine/threonine protein kinase